MLRKYLPEGKICMGDLSWREQAPIADSYFTEENRLVQTEKISLTRPRKKSNLAAARARMYHELVFESAERVFAEEGFYTATMQDLANEAGISLKTLYATFEGKDDIYREILRVRGAGLAEGIREITGGEGTARGGRTRPARHCNALAGERLPKKRLQV